MTRAKASPGSRPPRIDVAAEVAALEHALGACARPERAAAERAYMKSSLVFLGCGQPGIRAVASAWARAHRGLCHDELRALVDALMTSAVYEHRSVAIGLLAKLEALVTRGDLPWLAELCRHTAMWAHVDWIAYEVVSRHMGRSPASLPILRDWAKDPSFWVRRLAILAQLRQLRVGEGDHALFEEITVPMLEEKEFFIRKAIGWALRELGKVRPEVVRAYVQAHGDRMSGLTRREATKYLPAPAAPPRRATRGPRARG